MIDRRGCGGAWVNRDLNASASGPENLRLMVRAGAARGPVGPRDERIVAVKEGMEPEGIAIPERQRPVPLAAPVAAQIPPLETPVLPVPFEVALPPRPRGPVLQPSGVTLTPPPTSPCMPLTPKRQTPLAAMPTAGRRY